MTQTYKVSSRTLQEEADLFLLLFQVPLNDFVRETPAGIPYFDLSLFADHILDLGGKYRDAPIPTDLETAHKRAKDEIRPLKKVIIRDYPQAAFELIGRLIAQATHAWLLASMGLLEDDYLSGDHIGEIIIHDTIEMQSPSSPMNFLIYPDDFKDDGKETSNYVN